MKSFSPILKNNNRGVALLLVMASITLLAFILSTFTFDANLNKLKVLTQIDRSQAKQNAFAGLKMAMARLQFYKEARNFLEKKPNIKKNISDEILNKIFNVPFTLPIPMLKSFNQVQKDTVIEFNDTTVLPGKVNVFIQEASNLININLLRIHSLRDFDPNKFSKSNNSSNTNNNTNTNQQSGGDDSEDNPVIQIEKKLVEMLAKAIESEREKDEDFDLQYPDLEPEKLISVLKYNVNPKESVENDPDMVDTQLQFDELNITPKHAAMSTETEIYSLPGWDDRLVSLISNDWTVHGNMSIDLNKMNENLLKLLIPDIEEEQIKEFYDYRDNPEDPHFFNSFDDFKKYVTEAGFTDQESLDKTVKELSKAGIKFGTSSSLFKIISTGEYANAQFTITAWVTLPVKPPPKPKKANDTGPNTSTGTTSTTTTTQTTGTPTNNSNKKRVLQFLEPRIVEMATQ